VLICFGGADSRDHTSAAIEALAPLAGSLHVTVVLGAANRNVTTVERACRILRDHDLLVAPPDFATILAKSSLAIGAGGTMAWERACLGVPAVAFGIAANQVRVLEYLFEAGCALGLAELFDPDVEAIRSCVSVAQRNPAMMAGMARRATAVVDGNGARRVADAMLPGAVTFRAATLLDSEMIFAWRNHPAIRAVSRNPAEIPRDTHRRWMEATLRDAGRALLVAECGGQPVGIVRFDFDGEAATISVYRAPASDKRRIGLIPRAVAWIEDNRPDIRRIVAEVMDGNTTSLSAFESAGFVERERVLERRVGR
jgi:RimJ/RimL family protein N-acetyltransferase